MTLCFVSVGSNVERERNVRGALQALRACFGPLLVSSVYETPAVGFAGDPFYNLVIACRTDSTVHTVVQTLRDIETAHGRMRGEPRFAARTLDLDLLLYGDAVMREEKLTLPRAEIVDYAFVLGPLAEIAPDLRHPLNGETYLQIWNRFTGARSLKVVRFDF